MKTIDARLFWERLDNVRDSLGLTLTELCESKPGLIYRTLTQQRTRNILPNVETLALLAEALNVSLDFLVSGRKEVDAITKHFKHDSEMIKFANRITLCTKSQILFLNNMLDTWGIDKEPGEFEEQDEVLVKS